MQHIARPYDENAFIEFTYNSDSFAWKLWFLYVRPSKCNISYPHDELDVFIAVQLNESMGPYILSDSPFSNMS